MNGWIKIHREMLQSATWLALTARQKVIMIYLLFEAGWKEKKRYCSRCCKKITVPVGGIFKSLTELSEKYEEPRSSIYATILKLEKLDFTERVINDCHVIYVIKNYHKYQYDINVTGGETERKRNENGTQTERSLYLKKLRSKEDLIKLDVEKFHEEIPIAEYWMDKLPYFNTKSSRDATLPKWLDALEKLHRIDGHNYRDIRDLIELIVDDTGSQGSWNGWAKNCQSPMKLRKKNKDGIPYFDYIKSKLNTPKPYQRPVLRGDPTS